MFVSFFGVAIFLSQQHAWNRGQFNGRASSVKLGVLATSGMVTSVMSMRSAIARIS